MDSLKKETFLCELTPFCGERKSNVKDTLIKKLVVNNITIEYIKKLLNNSKLVKQAEKLEMEYISHVFPNEDNISMSFRRNIGGFVRIILWLGDESFYNNEKNKLSTWEYSLITKHLKLKEVNLC